MLKIGSLITEFLFFSIILLITSIFGYLIGYNYAYSKQILSEKSNYSAVQMVIDFDSDGDIIYYLVKRFRRSKDKAFENITLKPSKEHGEK